MKQCLAAIALCLTCTPSSNCAGGSPIKSDQTIEVVAKLMKDSGYLETGLDMSPGKGTELKMWTVGEGVLIFAFSQKDRKVVSISYFLCDERPKASRKTFEFSVTEFDPKTGEMRIKPPDKPNR
jgi:hypothetical protein